MSGTEYWRDLVGSADPDRQRALALQDARHATRQATAALAAATNGEPSRDRVTELSVVHAALTDALHTLERLSHAT